MGKTDQSNLSKQLPQHWYSNVNDQKYFLSIVPNLNFLHHMKTFSDFLRCMDSNYLQHSEFIFRSLYVSSFRTISDIRISNFLMYPKKSNPTIFWHCWPQLRLSLSGSKMTQIVMNKKDLKYWLLTLTNYTMSSNLWKH